jgi:ABC-type Fe3+ transport system permease subunit
VNASEVVIGSLLALLLLGLALYFGARQLASLRRLRREDGLPEEERRYERRKAWRRLVSCGLMLVMAGLLIGLQFYAARAQELADKRVRLDQEEPPPWTAQEKYFVRASVGSLIALLVVLLVLLALAGVDLWATRRYGQREYRKLSEDRRAMIQRQANRLRQERNGPG